MKKIVTLGEVMLRLSPPGQQRFFQTHSFDVEFGGSEANVGAALAYWGLKVAHVTAFPDQELGWAAAGQLRKNGLDTQFISFLPGRMGVYYLEHGAMQRSSQVIYDRAGSVFSTFDGKGLDWDTILDGADYFHWSGITPALSKACAELVKTAIQKANEKGIPVCGDLSFRSNLWKYGKAPHEIMPSLMEGCSLMIGGLKDFNVCLHKSWKKFSEAKKEIYDLFPRLTYVAQTDRQSSSASENKLSAELHGAKKSYSSKTYALTHIVDRVGSGDAFAGGLLYGLMHFKPQQAIEFAMAAGALKHGVPGDILLCSLAEIQEVASGQSLGKIKR
ncbi:MAG: PfkB family carbohydrate kinase [Bacteroidota bacterium]